MTLIYYIMIQLNYEELNILYNNISIDDNINYFSKEIFLLILKTKNFYFK
jgi:hypothetical protein